jgi:TATA-binding protein-associated factor Taf7
MADQMPYLMDAPNGYGLRRQGSALAHTRPLKQPRLEGENTRTTYDREYASAEGDLTVFSQEYLIDMLGEEHTQRVTAQNQLARAQFQIQDQDRDIEDQQKQIQDYEKQVVDLRDALKEKLRVLEQRMHHDDRATVPAKMKQTLETLKSLQNMTNELGWNIARVVGPADAGGLAAELEFNRVDAISTIQSFMRVS